MPEEDSAVFPAKSMYFTVLVETTVCLKVFLEETRVFSNAQIGFKIPNMYRGVGD